MPMKGTASGTQNPQYCSDELIGRGAQFFYKLCLLILEVEDETSLELLFVSGRMKTTN